MKLRIPKRHAPSLKGEDIVWSLWKHKGNRAHPRKRKPGETFTNDDISGSSAIGNLADTILNIERPNIRITKNRDFGVKDYILCNYDPCNRRIFQANTGDRIVYSWDHTGIQLPEQPAAQLEEFKLQDGTDSSSPV